MFIDSKFGRSRSQLEEFTDLINDSSYQPGDQSQFPMESLCKSTRAEMPASRKFRALTFGGPAARVGAGLPSVRREMPPPR
jgi:hypothetical protein